MLYPELKLASGWNNTAGYQSIEVITKVAPRTTPVLRPLTARVALSGKLRRDGIIRTVWTWDILSMSYLDTIVSTYLSNYNTDSANVTLRTLKRDRTYGQWNAIMYLPVPDGDDEFGGYTQSTTSKATNLRIVFSYLIAI